MNIPVFQVDAFTIRPFAGNPAAVCPLPGGPGGPWPSDALLQSVAAENNLSETAFLMGADGRYGLRWFTPAAEVDLCGHATLATAFVLWECLGEGSPELVFDTRSGELRVAREDGAMRMDFPARPPVPCPVPDDLVLGLGRAPLEVLGSRDYLAVYGAETDVRALAPDMAVLARLDRMGVIVTAPADDPDTDFVSRMFAPGIGVPEDPVTGSSHCTLIPYWARRLGRNDLRARQVSARGGEIGCRLMGDRVVVSGRAVLVMQGTLYVDLNETS